MSTSIENRVVEMKFNNQDFERNAQATLTTLKNLDKSVNSLESVKGLDNISKAASRTDLTGLEKGIEAVKVKFSALEIIAISALNNIANRAINAGSKLLKSFTTDNIASGWQRYADKTTAVQTIMAATANQFQDTGVQMKYVEAQLDRLNWFTDETSHKFVDMVGNIGKFTSAGVKLDDAQQAMQGIALWASKSGASANEASRAMYNLSQAMGTGKLTMLDWRSIENANMATMEFKQTAIDTAVELGVLKDVGQGFVETMSGKRFSAASGFRDQLSEGWLNDKVMTAAFNKYSEFTNKLYDITEDTGVSVSTMLGYIDDYKAGVLDIESAASDQKMSVEDLSEALKTLSDDALDFSRSAFKFGQEAKTFQEAVEYVGEAVSTGWMKTFEIIFGNYEEAKRLWTSLSEELYTLFVENGEKRNDLLAEWVELGGKADLFAGLKNIWESIRNIMDAVKEAFREIFPEKTAADLAVFTLNFRKFTELIKPTPEMLDAIKAAFRGLFSVLNVVRVVVSSVFRAFSPLLKVFGQLGGLVIKAAGSFGVWLGNAVSGIVPLISYAAAFVSAMINMISRIPVLDYLMAGLQVVFTAASVAVMGVVSAFQKLRNIRLPDIRRLFSTLVNGLKNAVNSFRKIDFIDKLFSGIEKAANKIVPIFKKLANIIKNIALDIFEWFSGGGLTEMVGGFIEKIKAIGSTIIEFVRNGGIAEFLTNLREGFGKAGEGAEGFLATIKRFASEIGIGKVMAMAFSIAVLVMANNISNAATAFTGLMSGLNGLVKNFSLYRGVKLTYLTQIAAGVVAIAFAIKMLADIEADKLKAVAFALGGVLAVAGGIQILSAAVAKFTGVKHGLIDLGAVMLGFGVGLAAIMTGFAILNKSGDIKDMGKKIALISVMMVEFAAMSVLISRLGGGFGIGAVTMLAFAGSISVVILAFSKLAQMDISDIDAKMKVLAIAMGGFAVLAMGIGNIRIGSVIGLLALSHVFEKIMPILIDAANKIEITPETISTLKDLKELFIPLSISVASLMAGLGVLAMGLGKMGIGLALFASGIFLLEMVAERIKAAEFDKNDLIKAGVFIGGLLVLFGLITLLSGKDAGKHAIKLGVMIMAMTVAIGLLAGLAVLIGQIKDDSLVRGAIVIGGLLGMFAVIIALSKMSEKAKTGVIIATVISLVILTSELIALTFIPWQSLLVAAGSMTAVMLSFAAAFAIISKTRFDGSNLAGLGGMIIMLATIGTSFYLLQNIPWQNMLGMAGALSATLIALGISGRLLSMLVADLNVKNILILAGVVAGLMLAIDMMIAIPTEQALGAALALSAVMVSLGAMGKLISGISVGFDAIIGLAASVAALIAVVFALQALVPTLQQFANIEWETLGKAGAVLVVLSASLLILSRVGIEALVGVIGLLGIGVALQLLAPTLQQFASIDWGSIGKAALMLVLMTASLAILGKVGLEVIVGAAGLAILAGVLYFMVPVLQRFAEIDWAALGKAALVLTGMTVALALLGSIGIMVLAAGSGLMLAGVGILAFAAAISVLGPAIDAFPGAGALLGIAGGLILLGVAAILLTPAAPSLILAGVGFALLGAGISGLGNVDIHGIAGGLMLVAMAVVPFTASLVALGMAVPVLLVTAAGLGLLAAAMQSAAASFNASTAQMVSNFTTSMMRLPAIAQNVGMWIRTSLNSGLNGIAADMQTAGKNAEMGFRDGIGCHSFVQWAGSVGEWVMTSLGMGMSQSEGQAVNVASSTATTIGSIFSKLADFVRGVMNYMSGAAAQASSIASQVGADANFTSGALSQIEARQKAMSDTSRDAGQNMNQFKKNVLDVGDAFKGAVPEMDSFTEGLENLGGGGGGGGGGGAVGQAKDALSSLTDTIRGQIDIFSEWSKGQEISAQKMLSNMRSQIAGVSEWANNIRALAARGIDQGLLQTLTEMGPQGADKVAAFVQMTNAELAEAGQLYQQSLALPASAAAYITGSFRQVGADAMAGFVGSADPSGAYNSFQPVGQNSVDGLADGAGCQSPSWKTRQVGINMMIGLRNGLEQWSPQVLNVIKSFGAKMVREFESIGKNACEGFAKGIDANTGVIKRAAEKAMKDAVSAAESAGEIRSPSRLAERRLGKNFDLGIANGILKYTGAVTKASGSLMDQLVEGLASSMTIVNDIINGELDFNPVITPRLDISNISGDISAINSAFENKRLGVVGGASSTDQVNNGGQVIFNQYNNSPKALSRTEIYRQTGNQLNFAFRRNRVAPA